MTILATRPLRALVLLGGLISALAAHAEDSPHWNKAACQACHAEAAPVVGNIALKVPDTEETCDSCHGGRGDAISCRHASGIPSVEVNIADELLPFLKEGEVVCSTCHDVVYQCKNPTANHAARNRGFLRSRPSFRTGDYCLKCHESSEYTKLNPHTGVTQSPARSTCQLCHASIPETSNTGELIVEFNMQHDLNDMCFGCHNVNPHPKKMTFGGGARDEEDWVHFVQPSESVLDNMRKAKDQTGIGLPLNPLNGEVFCATCHNPHDFKVGGEHGTQVPAPRRRLRLNNICQACHDK